MMRIFFGMMIALVCADAAAAKEPVLPANFTTVTGEYNAQYVDKVRFDFPTPLADNFTDRVARCGVSNLTMESFVASGGVRTWIGPASGQVYSTDNQSIVAGGDVLKFVSEAEQIVVLNGREKYGSNKLGLLGKMADPSGESFKSQLDFNIDVAKTSAGYSMTFSKLRRAQQSTGYAANDGFSPIGVWKGSRADEIVPVIESVAKALNDCIQS